MFVNLNQLILIIFLFESISVLKVNSLYEELDKAIEAEKEQRRKVKLVEENIVAGIKNKTYDTVDRNIFKLGLDSIGINLIVHRAYATNISNFQMLNDYAANSKYPNISYYVFVQLWRELKDDDSAIPVNEFCILYETITEKIMQDYNAKNFDKYYIEFANIMLADIEKQIVKTSVLHLNTALAKNHYDLAVADRVYNINELLFDETICKVIDNFYEHISFRKLLEIMWSHKFTGQKASALICIFENLYPNKNDNPDETMLIAHYFYNLMQIKDYKKLIQQLKNKVQESIAKLPISVYNLYFCGNFFIRNVKYHDSIAPEFTYDTYKHSVYMHYGGFLNKQAEFDAIPVSENRFKLRNHQHKNECLYAGEDKGGFLWRERMVFTWQVNNNLTEDEMNKRLTWRVKLHSHRDRHSRVYEDELTITNEAYNEVLCYSTDTAIRVNNWKYRKVITIDGDDKRCRWTVDVCNDLH